MRGALFEPPLKRNEHVREVGLSEDGSEAVSKKHRGLLRIWRVAEGECDV